MKHVNVKTKKSKGVGENHFSRGQKERAECGKGVEINKGEGEKKKE